MTKYDEVANFTKSDRHEFTMFAASLWNSFATYFTYLNGLWKKAVCLSELPKKTNTTPIRSLAIGRWTRWVLTFCRLCAHIRPKGLPRCRRRTGRLMHCLPLQSTLTRLRSTIVGKNRTFGLYLTNRSRFGDDVSPTNVAISANFNFNSASSTSKMCLPFVLEAISGQKTSVYSSKLAINYHLVRRPKSAMVEI